VSDASDELGSDDVDFVVIESNGLVRPLVKKMKLCSHAVHCTEKFKNVRLDLACKPFE